MHNILYYHLTFHAIPWEGNSFLSLFPHFFQFFLHPILSRSARVYHLNHCFVWLDVQYSTAILFRTFPNISVPSPAFLVSQHTRDIFVASTLFSECCQIYNYHVGTCASNVQHSEHLGPPFVLLSGHWVLFHKLDYYCCLFLSCTCIVVVVLQGWRGRGWVWSWSGLRTWRLIRTYARLSIEVRM